MNQEEITIHLKKLLPELKEKFCVQNLWLFGSFIRTEQTANSDLDLLVTFENQNISLIEFIQLEQFLSEELGIQVDLVEKEMLKPTIGASILQEAVAL